MQSLAAQLVCTRSLQILVGGEGAVMGSCTLAPWNFSWKPQSSLTRMALLPSSPSPSFEGKFQSSSDAPTSKLHIPRMEPFNQSRIVRGMRELSLIEKAEHALSDRCLELEGDEAYRCWEALFLLEKMKEECKIQGNMSFGNERPKDRRALDHLEHIVRQSGGVSTLIDNLLMLSRMSRLQNGKTDPARDGNPQTTFQTGQSEEATDVANPACSELDSQKTRRETGSKSFQNQNICQKRKKNCCCSKAR